MNITDISRIENDKAMWYKAPSTEIYVELNSFSTQENNFARNSHSSIVLFNYIEQFNMGEFRTHNSPSDLPLAFRR